MTRRPRNILLGILLLTMGIALAADAPETRNAPRTTETPAGKEQQAETKEQKAETKEGGNLGMSILGNQEAPKSLVIVPWKSSELGGALGISPLLDDSRLPVDKEVANDAALQSPPRVEFAQPAARSPRNLARAQDDAPVAPKLSDVPLLPDDEPRPIVSEPAPERVPAAPEPESGSSRPTRSGCRCPTTPSASSRSPSACATSPTRPAASTR